MASFSSPSSLSSWSFSSSSSSTSNRNWVFDVFPSFSGEDVRKGFLSHFLEELDRKLIVAFKDNEIERSQSLDPELKKAIRTSRIAVVVFSKNYASSSWCLNELLEIVKCKEEFGQMLIPVFYGLDPSHVRKQTGDFGKIFEETCLKKTDEETQLWRQALTNVASILGYHSKNWHSEAKTIKEITNDVLAKLNLTPSKDFEDFVGMEDHIAEMSVLLHMESEEVRMVGIWGSSGIGKTTIARALFSRLSRHFQGSVYVDRAFVSKSLEIYNSANPDDCNMKLHLQNNFLCRILGKKDIKIDHLGAVEERLKQKRVIIFIDDLDNQVVLDTLVGQTQWFGCGSRIIVITKDKQFLKAHGIDHVYEVCLPTKELALEILCRSAFRKNHPPDGLIEFASEVAFLAGNLPLGLNVLGSYLRGRDKEEWMDMLPSLRTRLNGKIERALRVSYDGLNNKKDEAIFRHVACLFNGESLNDIRLLLADSDLDVNIGLKNLVDKSLIHVREGIVEMHCLLQEMGKGIVRAQSSEAGEREFLVDSRDIYDLLEKNTGTKKVIGISLDMDEIDELRIHKEAFKGMRNLRFLNIYTKKWDQKKEVKWHLPEGFNYLPPKLRLLRLDGYQMRCMPSNFRPENLVKLQMQGSKLDKLWEGVQLLAGLRIMDLYGSENLKEIPNLSMATNLKKLVLSYCSSLVELPSSIQYLHKLEQLHMLFCENLETLPTGINLKSLYHLNLIGCSRLKNFPDISTNITELDVRKTGIEEFPSMLRLENLIGLDMNGLKSRKTWKTVEPLRPLLVMLSPSLLRLELSDIRSLVELPSSIQKFNKLEYLSITGCTNLETLPNKINLQCLDELDLSGCSRLRTFPDISTNVSILKLNRTGIEEVPWWIEYFSSLKMLFMKGCNHLLSVSMNISKMKCLEKVYFSYCGVLTEARWEDSPCFVPMKTYDRRASFPRLEINFINCFNLDLEALLEQESYFFNCMRFSYGEVPSYFTHHTTGTYLANIHTSPSQPFLKFKAYAMVYAESISKVGHSFNIKVCCQSIDRYGNHIDSSDWTRHFTNIKHRGNQMLVFDCQILLMKENSCLPYEVNNDHVNIQFHLGGDDSELILNGCGIRLSKDDEVNEDNDLGLIKEIDNEEHEDWDVSDLGNKDNGTYHSEEREDCDVSDLGNEVFHSEECEKKEIDGFYRVEAHVLIIGVILFFFLLHLEF